MFIRSERLFLRPGWPEDREDVLARIADERIVANLATAPWPYTAKDARAFLEREQDPRLPTFVVTLPTGQGAQLIGSVGLSRDGEDVQLGYWIAREHWGEGYATESARAVTALARSLGHRRIVAHHFADNPASGRVLRKAGFRPTGVIGMRHSQGRGREARAHSYELELTPVTADNEPAMMRAA